MFPRGEPDQPLTLRGLDDVNMLNSIATAKQDIIVTQLMQEFITNFLVEKLQRTRTLVNNGHLHTQGGEHRSVFNPNHSGADYRHRARELWQRQDLVRGDDDLSVQVNPMRFTGACTDR